MKSFRNITLLLVVKYGMFLIYIYELKGIQEKIRKFQIKDLALEL